MTPTDNETTNGLGVHESRARATANPAASTHNNELKRTTIKAGARDSARVHCPDSQALTAITYTKRRDMTPTMIQKP